MAAEKRPTPGVDYPKTIQALDQWFATEEAFRACRMDSNWLVNDREPQEPAAMTRPVLPNFRGD